MAIADNHILRSLPRRLPIQFCFNANSMLNQSTTEKSAIKDAIAVGGVECNTSRNNNHSWDSHGTQIITSSKREALYLLNHDILFVIFTL
ncbi:hypothetical protein V5G28_032675 [Scytonema sp. PRP1]